MKSWMTSAKLFLAGIAVFMLCSCGTPQEKYISSLEDLTEKIENKGADFTAEQWEATFTEFQTLIEKQADLEFTSEQKEEIGDLQGRCVKAFTKAMGSQVKNAIKGLGSQVKGFFQGLSGAKDETKDDVKDAIQDVADGAKEAVDEVKDAIKKALE